MTIGYFQNMVKINDLFICFTYFQNMVILNNGKRCTFL